jgi:DNA-binding transcriptional MocR family regulator
MIIRRQHNGNFTIVPNAIFEDERISAEAKGLLGYLLSRPHEWIVRLQQLRHKLKIGRDRLQRVVKELIDAGYIEREDEQPRDDEKKFASYNYVVRDVPEHSVTFVPQPEKPLRLFRQRKTRNGNIISTESIKTEDSNPNPPARRQRNSRRAVRLSSNASAF